VGEGVVALVFLSWTTVDRVDVPDQFATAMQDDDDCMAQLLSVNEIPHYLAIQSFLVGYIFTSL
jgi:hypothetical protein